MRRSEVHFLSTRHVLMMHAEALAHDDGLPGVKEEGWVDSAVMAAENGYYTSLVEVAAAYAFGLGKGHGFNDGNKRTATYAMLAFLEVNGIELTLSPHIWVAIIEDVADGNVSREQLAEEIAREVGARHGRPGPPMYFDFDLEEDEAV